MRKFSATHRRLREADLWILEALAKMLFLTTSQVSRIFFEGSRWTANKRLRKLLDGGYIRVWVRSLTEDNIYSLDRGGAKAISQAWAETNPGHRARTPKGLDGNLTHLLLINDVRASIALDVQTLDAELVWWRSDWELRAANASLVPDARFKIRWDESHIQEFALEVDNNSRSPKGFVNKMIRYHSISNGQICVLVVGRNAHWVERYRNALAQTTLDLPVLFAVTDEIPDCCRAQIWRSIAGDHRYSLRELAFLPNRKDWNVEEAYTKQSTSPNLMTSYIQSERNSMEK
jgi:hypothetical protein